MYHIPYTEVVLNPLEEVLKDFEDMNIPDEEIDADSDAEVEEDNHGLSDDETAALDADIRKAEAGKVFFPFLFFFFLFFFSPVLKSFFLLILFFIIIMMTIEQFSPSLGKISLPEAGKVTLFEGTRLTAAETNVVVLQLSLRHKFSTQGLKDTLAMLRLLLPADSYFPTSLLDFQKFFSALEQVPTSFALFFFLYLLSV